MAKPEWFEQSRVIHQSICMKMEPMLELRSTEELRFLALAIAGEAGELANLVKKEWRDSLFVVPTWAEWRDQLKEEVADIRIYLQHIAECLDMDLDEECVKKLAIVAKRPYAQAATNEPEGS